MALITNKFKVTVVDDLSTDPTIDQTVNFTDDQSDDWTTKTVTVDSANTGDVTNNVPKQLSTESATAKYIVIQSTKKLYIYVSDTQPTVVVGSETLSVTNLLVLSGTVDVDKLWAVSTDIEGNNTYVKLTYLY